MNQSSYLYDELLAYTASEAYPFHMPGHKRRLGSMTDPYQIDITEIDGFDNLHHAEGILLEAQQRAAALYGSSETHFLVNGSTGGILAAISAAVCAGAAAGRSGIAMARNAHKSAFHAVYLNDLEPVWLYPQTPELTRYGGADTALAMDDDDRTGIARLEKSEEYEIRIDTPQSAQLEERVGRTRMPQTVLRVESEGRTDMVQFNCRAESCERRPAAPQGIGGRISAMDVEDALTRHPDIGTVFIVSPTYDGVISDVSAIAAAAHAHGAILIVDEAHGAHFGLTQGWPRSSVQQGADLVIHSLHKTMPALTQTALLHVNGTLIDRELLHRFLQIYQTSSPSYVLMASIDQCVRRTAAQQEGWFSYFREMLKRFYQRMKQLRVLQCAHADDLSRILILPGGSRLSGKQICDMLRDEYGLELEMSAPDYALALTSVGDDEEGLVRLGDALLSIDEKAYIRQRFGSGQADEQTPGEQMSYRQTPGEQMSYRQTSKEQTPEARMADKPRSAEERPVADGRRSDAQMTDKQTFVSACSIRRAWDGARQSVSLDDALGRTAGEFVYLYPPGIPILVPGEVITQQSMAQMRQALQDGFELQGMKDLSAQTICVTEG